MAQYELINESYEGLQGIAQYVNDTSGGIITPLMLLALWIVMLISQLGFGFQRAFLVSSFIASGISIMMVIMNFLAPTYMYISFVFVGLGIVMTRLQHNQ